MEYRPHSYQQTAIDWMLTHDQAGLFMEMGTGKTSISLTALLSLMWERFTVNQTLIIAPARVVSLQTWQHELQKWDHLKEITVVDLSVSADERERRLQQRADLTIISRDLVVWLVNTFKSSWPYDCLIIDELSSFKDPSSQRFRALRKVAKHSRYRYGLTGTPSSNGYGDLWSEIYLLDYGQRLGTTLGEFRRRYFRPGRSNGHIVYDWILQSGAKEQIDAALADLCISMQAQDLPALTVNNIIFDLDPAPMVSYKILERELILTLEDDTVVAASRAVATNKLQQLTSGAVYSEDGKVLDLGQQKLDLLGEIIETTDKPILCFYAYKHERDRILQRFGGRDLKTDHDQQDWNAGKIPLLVVHPASVGYGLNIQYGSNVIVWFGLTWSLELYQQANARLWRQGQIEGVIVHRLLARGTVDEFVVAALERKDLTQEGLMEALRAKL